MLTLKHLNKDQSGQTALEAAIILIAFIVVASLFAFAILSAGTSSTEEAEQAVYAGLSGVQSSLQVRGAVVAEKAAGATVATVRFTVALSAGGEAVDLTEPAALAADRVNRVLIGYRTDAYFTNELTWTVDFLGNNDTDNLLEDGELAEFSVTMPVAPNALGVATEFTLEVKPPTGGVLNITRTTPVALEAINELR